MAIPARIPTSASYTRLLSGLNLNGSRLLRAQNQLTTGLRIAKPSDDPAGAARVLGLNQRLAEAARRQEALLRGVDTLDSAGSELQGVSGLYTDLRELVVQSLNGTLNDGDREVIASEIKLLREQLLEFANAQLADRHLFGGTESRSAPFEEVTIDGKKRVIYKGDSDELELEIGSGLTAPITLAGDAIFGAFEPSGVTLTGNTGVALGSTANEGTSYDELVFRTTSTNLSALTASGIGAGPGDSTLLGTQQLVIDAGAGTIQLGSGPVTNLSDFDLSEVTVENEAGGTASLDLSAWDGADVDAAIVAEGSVAFAGGAAVPIDFTDTDFRMTDPATGNIVHLDMTGVSAEGSELVSYSGAVNAFDVIEGIIEDLENDDGLNVNDVFDRLGDRLNELDRHMGRVTQSLGVIGSRSSRLSTSADRFAEAELRLEGLRSDVQDVDLTAAVIDLQRSQTALQMTQAAGAQLLNTSLLDYLR